jgi:hypothetical protein
VLREDLAMAMTGWQQQMHSADHSEGEEHILDALLNPRLRDEWTQAARETKAKYLRTVMARLVCYLARSPVNTYRAFPKRLERNRISIRLARA